jgi:hypothetical protein
LAKAAAKQVLGGVGNGKYTLHATNRLVTLAALRDERKVQEFLRCNPHWAGVSAGDRGDSIHEVLTPRFLDRLVARGGSCILYTHLGKLTRDLATGGFSAAAIAAFRTLASYSQSGKILVTTTARLLESVSSAQHTTCLAPTGRCLDPDRSIAERPFMPLKFPTL